MLQLFKYQDQEIRFVGTPEAPEWVAADIVQILYPEMGKKDRSNVLGKVPEKWTGMKRIHTRSEDGTEQRRQVKTLLEPGLYQLVIRSNSPHAMPFQELLFEEILPSIRKTGSYGQLPPPAEPKALPPVPEISKRNQARKLVDERAIASGLQHSRLWQQGYSELEYRFGYPIARSRAKNKLEKVETDG
jgi:prophage antirepressor-like protein